MIAFLATSCGDEKNNVNTGWEYEVSTLYDLEITSLDGEELGTIKRDTKTFCFSESSFFIKAPKEVVNFWRIENSVMTIFDNDDDWNHNLYLVVLNVENSPRNCN